MSTIVSLEVRNMKRIRVAEIDASNKPVVTISGKNAAGKSSLLDGIFYALAGGRAQASDPVRHGEEAAEVVVALDDGIQIRRSWSSDGKTRLTIETRDGDLKRSPQRWLDERIGALSFDPLSFLRLDAKEQAEKLRKAIGVDTTDLDDRRADLYLARTSAGRDAKSLAGQLAGLVFHEGAERVDSGALLGELDKIRDAFDKRQGEIDRARRAGESADIRRESAEALRARAKALLADADNDEKEMAVWIATKDAAERAASKIVVDDDGPIRERLASAEEANRKVRENEARAAVADEKKRAESRVNTLTQRIKAVDDEKRRLMESATIPVDGLALGESGLLFRGVPLAQASSAEQIRVGMAMSLAMNPEIRIVLIREGSLLDEDSVALVASMAEDAGAQVWMEVVGSGPDGSVIIEDGLVAGREA